MILTVTLNPAIDKTIEVKNFEIAQLNKVLNTLQDPGGKGINVSKVVESLGGKSIATGFLGGSAGRYISDALERLEIEQSFIWIQGETRTNMKVFDAATHETTEINEPGPLVTGAETEALLDKIGQLLKSGDILVISGSAPKSISSTYYSDLVAVGKNAGATVFLDTSGDAFVEGIKAKPDFIKPNRHELEVYFGHEIPTDADLKVAGAHFIEKGVENVFISLGGEGAFYCDKDHAFRLRPLKVEAHSSVGAGDAFVGAFVYGLDRELGLNECLKLSVATSAGAVMTVGTKPMNVEWIMNQLDLVVIDQI